ncbi:hypothetical protein V2J09_018848 [Rumex salicifolius]
MDKEEVEADSITCDSTSSTSTITDLMEDASSSSSDSNSSSLKGPLYELSELMTQLPIKRGLSKHYEGKSQSFTSLTSVQSLEDLAKEENPYNKRMKLCRSYGGRLSGHGQRFCTPKHTIAKKGLSRNSFLSTMVGRNHLLSNCNSSHIIPLQK